MQRDEIDVMWQQALRDSVKDGEMFTRYHFAEMIAAKEREACAKEADKRLHDFTMLTSNPPQSGAAFSIAQAIRARGEA